MSRRYTVKTNYNAIKTLIDNHKVYRGNNTSFCIDMGFENRTSWVSDLKRSRNLPSPEEAARICVLLQTTPEEILMHEGKTEKETEKCQKDIALVRSLIEQEKAKSNEKPPVDDERFLPLAERREALSKAGIHILLDADAKVTEDQLDDIISFIEIQQRRNGR